MRGDAIARAEKASALLDQEISKETLANMREGLVRAIEQLDTGSADGQYREHELCETLRLLSNFKSRLMAAVDRGRLEDRLQTQKESTQRRANDPRWS